MRVGWDVHRHAGDTDGKIGAMVEVEATQEILVGFAVPAVLGNDDAGNVFEDFTGTQRRTRFDASGRHPALAGGIGCPDTGLIGPEHFDFRSRDLGFSRACRFAYPFRTDLRAAENSRHAGGGGCYYSCP